MLCKVCYNREVKANQLCGHCGNKFEIKKFDGLTTFVRRKQLWNTGFRAKECKENTYETKFGKYQGQEK